MATRKKRKAVAKKAVAKKASSTRKKNKAGTKKVKKKAVVKALTTALPASAGYSEAAYQQLRECLAAIRGWPVSRIHEDTVLEDDMGYDEGARAALAAELSDCFANHNMRLSPLLRAAETRGCTTVADLDDLIQPRV